MSAIQHRRCATRVRVLLQITGDDGTAGAAEEVAAFEKVTQRLEGLGLSIAEGKELLAADQHGTVKVQAAVWSQQHRRCPICGGKRRCKGSYPVVFRTLFGDVELDSPRLHRCQCQCQDTAGPATVSPLRDLITDHVAPERLYLEARWASLVPYAAAAGLLADILPIASGANAKTLQKHVLRVAERAEAELGEERPCFIDGCPADWAGLPIAEGRIVVGLDGGYVRDWDDRKTNFEVIVGQSVPEDRDAVIAKRFAKRQQMQWTKRGAHLLLQTRTRTLDGTFRRLFERSYPGLANDNADGAAQAIAA